MNGNYLLDTNIVIGIFGNDSAVLSRLSAAIAVYVPAIVLGELYYGAYKSQRPLENCQRIADFSASCVILACDMVTAEHYGRIKNALRELGRPIPENDIWIAALASQHALTVASRDGHFADVATIATEAW